MPFTVSEHETLTCNRLINPSLPLALAIITSTFPRPTIRLAIFIAISRSPGLPTASVEMVDSPSTCSISFVIGLKTAQHPHSPLSPSPRRTILPKNRSYVLGQPNLLSIPRALAWALIAGHANRPCVWKWNRIKGLPSTGQYRVLWKLPES